MTLGRGHVAIVIKLGLRLLGLAPVDRRRSTVTNRVAARGRSGYPEGCATGSHVTLPYWSPHLLIHSCPITTDGCIVCYTHANFNIKFQITCGYGPYIPDAINNFQCHVVNVDCRWNNNILPHDMCLFCANGQPKLCVAYN